MEDLIRERKTTRKRRAKRVYSPTKLRIMLLLQAGVALSFAGTIGRQFKVLKEFSDEWKDIDRQYLHRIVREFYVDRLVSEKENGDGTKTLVLTEKGKKRALTFNFQTLTIPKQERWNELWHCVFFDIPEKLKLKRHALRAKLYDLGFYHWQKSVFVHPYPCRDQIDFVVEFFGIRRYVRYGVLTNITNEAELLLHFGLTRTTVQKRLLKG